ncbi:MAG: hypothetical protein KME29_31745 [Calothrix sp. FI2-JRJ7]|jgi:hypothetical protein|nr:hypothetical protein [Calothrix sp. FI2-JRJ7]
MTIKTARVILRETATLYAKIKHLPREQVKFYLQNIDSIDLDNFPIPDKQ